MIDSVFRIDKAEADQAGIRYEAKKDYTPLDDYEWESDHGYKVIDELYNFAPEATFYTYRVTDNRMPLDRMMRAVNDAAEDGCHLINMSIGQPTRADQPEHMFICESAKNAVVEGSTVVAAAGKMGGETTKVRCPAVSESVVAVGSLMAECGGQQFGEIPAKGSYWLKLEDSVTKICGFQDCDDDRHTQTCDRNQDLYLWDKNPDFEDREPDTLTPSTWPYLTERGKTRLDAGTSFSAPVVTSALACILSDLSEYPQVPDIKTAIIESNRSASDLEYGILDYPALRSELEDS